MEESEHLRVCATESLLNTIYKKGNINLKQQILFVSQLITIITGIKIIEKKQVILVNTSTYPHSKNIMVIKTSIYQLLDL